MPTARIRLFNPSAAHPMFDTSDFTLTAYTASDGENLSVYDWPLADGRPQRGTVLLVHGLGEHAGRYHAVAHHLNAWGFAVRAYDQYGHGQSDGPRGGLNHDMRLLDDLADIDDLHPLIGELQGGRKPGRSDIHLPVA